MHKIHVDGTAPEESEQLAATKEAYPGIRNFETWVREQAGQTSNKEKGWNNVSLFKLMFILDQVC